MTVTLTMADFETVTVALAQAEGALTAIELLGGNINPAGAAEIKATVMAASNLLHNLLSEAT